MNGIDSELVDAEEVPIQQVMRDTVIRCARGALGYVVSHQRARHQNCVYLGGQGRVFVPDDTPVQIVVQPEDLAYAYVERPAMHPMVQHALDHARRAAVHVMDHLAAPNSR